MYGIRKDAVETPQDISRADTEGNDTVIEEICLLLQRALIIRDFRATGERENEKIL